jgi:membrane fusion protein, copper/silver efflux system
MEKEKIKIYGKYAMLIIVGLIIGWIMFGRSSDDHQHHEVAESDTEIIYTCSMHPQVRQPAPGDCPICGMDLIPVSDAEDDQSDDPFFITLQDSRVQWANVRTQLVGSTDQGHSIRLSGRVVPNEQNTSVISANFPGRIERLYADYTGRFIRRGERLARIYSPELMQAQQELIQAAASKEQQPRMYEAARQRLRLFRLTDAQIQQIEQGGEASPTTDFYASQSGYLTQRAVSEGDYVSTGETLFTITDLSNVWVELNVYENQIGQIRRGDMARLRIPAQPDAELSGEVEFVDPFINPETRVARARLTVKNPDNLLKPEMLVEATLSSKPSNGTSMVIPQTAVLWTGQRSVVYVKQPAETGMRFEFREIETGARTEEGYLVTSGLSAGEEIAVNGVFAIDAASQLRGHYSMMAPPERVLIPQPFKNNLETLFNIYFELKNALAADDPQKVQKHAANLQTQLQNTGEHSLEGEHHMFWMEQYNAIRSSLTNFIASNNLPEMRIHFEPLSKAFIETAQTLGGVGRTFYVAYCPMVDNDRGAYWLSEFKEIMNPYFGDMMLRCGEVRETIREGTATGQVQQQREVQGHVH